MSSGEMQPDISCRHSVIRVFTEIPRYNYIQYFSKKERKNNKLQSRLSTLAEEKSTPTAIAEGLMPIATCYSTLQLDLCSYFTTGFLVHNF
jgi:hypothetical protein